MNGAQPRKTKDDGLVSTGVLMRRCIFSLESGAIPRMKSGECLLGSKIPPCCARVFQGCARVDIAQHGSMQGCSRLARVFLFTACERARAYIHMHTHV